MLMYSVLLICFEISSLLWFVSPSLLLSDFFFWKWPIMLNVLFLPTSYVHESDINLPSFQALASAPAPSAPPPHAKPPSEASTTGLL
jgi:hypothetical protein